MKLTKQDLTQIIKEELDALLKEAGGGTLYVSKGWGNAIRVEDDKGEEHRTGEMIRSLLNAGIEDFASPNDLARMRDSDAKGIQGGLERWDSDVFPDIYDVDLGRLVQLYAKQNGMQVEEVEQEEEW